MRRLLVTVTIGLCALTGDLTGYAATRMSSLSRAPQGSALAPDAAADVVTGRVRGRVLDRGRGLGKATVTLRATDPRKTSHEATSDAEGRFGLDQVEPGRYMLVAERPGSSPRSMEPRAARVLARRSPSARARQSRSSWTWWRRASSAAA